MLLLLTMKPSFNLLMEQTTKKLSSIRLLLVSSLGREGIGWTVVEWDCYNLALAATQRCSFQAGNLWMSEI
jgi:hypothetical protein